MITVKKQNETAMPTSTAATAYELLSEIRHLILAEPKRFDQTHWLTQRVGLASYTPKQYPACGTVGCVAGWVRVLKRPHATESTADTPFVARRVLKISKDKSFELFAGAACGATKGQTLSHAKAGAKHIAKFQRKYAKQLKRTRV